MNKFLKKILLIITLQLFITNGYSQDIDSDVANAYAEFIEVLIQNITGLKNGKFCIFGSDEITDAIKLRNKEYFEIKDDSKNDLKNIDHCNTIYICSDKQKSLKFYGNIFSDRKILTIANYNGFALNEEGMIEIQLGRRNFEIIVNKKTLKANGFMLKPLINSYVIN
jgi:hypothetical protein